MSKTPQINKLYVATVPGTTSHVIITINRFNTRNMALTVLSIETILFKYKIAPIIKGKRQVSTKYGIESYE